MRFYENVSDNYIFIKLMECTDVYIPCKMVMLSLRYMVVLVKSQSTHEWSSGITFLCNPTYDLRQRYLSQALASVDEKLISTYW